jgi:hypothetical protein
MDIGADSSKVSPDQLSVNSAASSGVDYESLKQMGTVVISVKDSGVGMTEENLHNLFQEGVQFHANQLQQGKGSGLGLWVSKGFAMRHNGDITAESDGMGLGSTFKLKLPAYMRKSSLLESLGALAPDPELGGAEGYAKVPTSVPMADADYLSLSFPARKQLEDSPKEISASPFFKVYIFTHLPRYLLCASFLSLVDMT